MHFTEKHILETAILFVQEKNDSFLVQLCPSMSQY